MSGEECTTRHSTQKNKGFSNMYPLLLCASWGPNYKMEDNQSVSARVITIVQKKMKFLKIFKIWKKSFFWFNFEFFRMNLKKSYFSENNRRGAAFHDALILVSLTASNCASTLFQSRILKRNLSGKPCEFSLHLPIGRLFNCCYNMQIEGDSFLLLQEDDFIPLNI